MTKNPVKTKYHLQWSLNLFYKILFILTISFLFAIVARQSKAVNISAVYFSACMRETGVIINVDDTKLQLLTLNGEVRSISRFNIIYIANYPVGNILIPRIANGQETDIITVKTIFKDQVVDLVKGWMIDYSEERISFLTLAGTQTIIDTADIWDIEITPFQGATNVSDTTTQHLNFVHPYPFMHCGQEDEKSQPADLKSHPIYPQHLLADPMLIKKELDRLKEGYDKVRDYDSSKQFYPVPQIYTNDTTLGIWVNTGSRYGASKNRSNSFMPVITSELTEGPFGFQRILVTGNAPMPYGLHEEPQMQAYYRLKASYVHFSIMVDFNRFNMGAKKYKWSAEDLESKDHRENDIYQMAGGFDYGPFAIDITILNGIYYAVRHENEFHEDDMQLNRGGIFFHNRFVRMELYYGFADDSKEPPITLPDDVSGPEKAYIDAYNEALAAKHDFFADFQFFRFNLELYNFDKYHPRFSVIYKTLDFDRKNNPDGEGEFHYSGSSLTQALYLDYPLQNDLKLSGYLSLEIVDKKHGKTSLDESSSATYPKGGLSVALYF